MYFNVFVRVKKKISFRVRVNYEQEKKTFDKNILCAFSRALREKGFLTVGENVLKK